MRFRPSHANGKVEKSKVQSDFISIKGIGKLVFDASDTDRVIERNLECERCPADRKPRSECGKTHCEEITAPSSENAANSVIERQHRGADVADHRDWRRERQRKETAADRVLGV